MNRSCCCLLLFCLTASQLSIAGVFGFDDFNDNVRDGTKWALPDFSAWGGQVLETGSRLTFTSPGGGGWATCTWLAPMPALSNWMVSCDVVISGAPATSRSWWRLWIKRIAPYEPDRIGVTLQQSDGAAYELDAATAAAERIITNRTADSLQSTLRLEYFGKDNVVRAEYRGPAETNFHILTEFGTASWAIDNSSTFAITLEAYSVGPVSIGQMTADNFQVAPLVPEPVAGPEIVSSPVSHTTVVGQSSVFGVSASGFPSSYQWLKDGQPIPGATQSFLRLTNLQTNQSGEYSVIASNSFGQITSLPALLTVLPPLRVTRYSVQELLEQGSLNPIQRWLESNGIPVDIISDLSLPIANKVLLLPCLDGDLALWEGHVDTTNIQNFVKRGGLLIAMGGTTIFLNRVFGLSLLIAPDRGAYSRTEEASGTPFQYGPQFLSNPNRPPNEQRPPCAMGISASSLPASARQIYRDEGVDLSFLTIIPYGEGNIVVIDWDSYFVYPFTPLADGWYETFDLALALRAGVSPVAPRITRDLKDQSPLEGSDLTLVVLVAGTGPIGAHWFRNGELIVGASGSPLTLHSVSSRDAGDYMCVITNNAGAVTSRVARIEVRATKGRVGLLANTYATNLAHSIESAGFTPLIITNMKGYDLSRLDLLMIDNWNAFSFPDVVSRSAEIREWAANGGKLILHGSASFLADTLQFAPGCDEITFISSPDNLVVDGPYGSLPPDLRSGRWHYYSTVAVPSVPARALPVFGIGCGTNLLAFSYGLGLGSVYYCSIDFPSMVTWDGTGVYANLYVPNLLAHAMNFTSSGTPILINQKTNASILPLRSIQFFAAVGGGGPLSYQWYHDGAAIDGATNAAFRIENATTNDSGHYSVSATNPFGAITEELGSLAVVDPIPFRLLALLESNPQTVSDNLSGSPYGGIAVSTDQIFYSGSTGTVRFPAFPLGAGTIGESYYGVVSDLRTEKVYALGGSNGPAASSTEVITSLIELDQSGRLTSHRVDLSEPLRLNFFNGLFAAKGAVVLACRESVYRIDLPSGQVTGLGAVLSLPPNHCYNSVYSGIAEAFSNSVYLVYVAEPGRIVRTDLTSGITTTLASFADRRDICAFTVSPRLGRWFFHGSGSSGDLGSAVALFDSPPRVLTALTNRVIKEDTMTGAITFNIQDMDTPPNKLLVSAQSSNPDLLPPSGVILSGTSSVRTLALKPATNQFGTSTVTIVVRDALGQSTNVSFTLTVTPVNDPPSFSAGQDIRVLEDSGPFSFPHWATNISPGPANESDQIVSFIITNDNSNLFAAGPKIDSEGNLSFAPRPDVFGNARVSVYAEDSGGALDGGFNRSAVKSFEISVGPVNDAPSFVVGENISIDEDAGPQILAGWASNIRAGPSDESGQKLTFTVESSNRELFASLPAVSPDGTLTFTPAPNSNGVSVVNLVLRDDGGTAEGGRDASEVQTFTIRIRPVNDAPIALSRTYEIAEDTTLTVILDATDVDGDRLTFKVRSLPRHGELTGTGGILTYTPATNFFGADSFTFTASDSLVDSAEATIEITVTPVNDPPVAVISFSPAVKLLPDSFRSVVITRNNTNAAVALDGRGSYDVEGDPLQFTWWNRDQNVIIAAIPLVTNAFNIGINVIRLEVDDGRATGSADEVVEVIRADQAVRLVIDFVSLAGLPENRKQQLIEILEDATEAFAGGGRTEGIHSLRVFKKKVLASGAPPSLVQILTNAAELIIRSQLATPRLVTSGYEEQGRLQFTFECESGWTYTVQTSSDLVHWTTGTDVFDTNGFVHLIVPVDSPIRFYRLVPRDN